MNVSIAARVVAACGVWFATTAASAQTFRLENAFLSRKIGTIGGHLATIELVNKRCNKVLVPSNHEEFRLRLSQSVDSQEPDVLLTSADFEVLALGGDAETITAELCNAVHGLRVTAAYTLKPGNFYGRKRLTIVSEKGCTLELADVESLAFDDAFAPYRAKDMMWTTRKFLPALGQPLYTSGSATFWGVEFPACWNRVENGTIRCGYQRGVELEPGIAYETHRAVFGAADDPEYVQDAFFEYVDEIRVAPVELKVQYNSWFDFGGSVTQERFLESLETLHQELVVKRGCKPLDVYTIDDGWQNSRPPRSSLADWSKGLYPVNDHNFDKDLQSVRQAIEAKGSKMGIWVSPACIFGARANIDVLEQAGFEVLVGSRHKKSGMIRKSMSMTGPKYMELLEKRLLELVDLGSVYFKLDGIFGDLSCRYFETKPGRGAPVMSHLFPPELRADDPLLDDPKFDETKRYYVTAAVERLMNIFDQMHHRNRDVRILCHNAATISPWWLMHLDVLSLVNSRDGAPGDRREQMCYRDGLYFQLTRNDRNQVPLNCFFNHEPAKGGNRFDDATLDGFREYFFMALSRGTTTVELYFVVKSLDAAELDVIAEGLKWLDRVAPAFKRSRMHGESPLGPTDAAEDNLSTKKLNLDEVARVYGYTGWTESQGYVSIHNPLPTAQTYSFQLDRKLGLVPGSGPFALSYVVGNAPQSMSREWKFGETVTVNLRPRSVVVLNFERIEK